LSAADTAARRARLWSPEGGIMSSELDVVSENEMRRRRLRRLQAQRDAEQARQEWAQAAAIREVVKRAEEAIRPIQGLRCRDVLNACSRHFGLPVQALMSSSRSQKLAYPRQIGMYVMKECGGHSFPMIGRAIGGRDHTTAIHGHRKIAAGLPTNPKWRTDVAAVQRLLEC
jgi:chromosomal replication initiation ATPase DnaA